jgi:Amt family ammonium transporter
LKASLIVCGAVAERLNFVCYYIYATILTGFSYPVASRWGWNNIGWLKTMVTNFSFTVK